jgi:hypothetical protein
MEGPKISDIRDVLDAFDFDKYGEQGRVDFTEGVAWPGGGVYIVGHCDDDRQDFLLNYYKVTGQAPVLSFLPALPPLPRRDAAGDCPGLPRPPTRHRSTPRPEIEQRLRLRQKRPHPRHPDPHALGSDEIYGLVDSCAHAEARHHLPLEKLVVSCDDTGTPRHAIVRRAIARDEPLLLSDVEIADTPYHRLLARQAALTA